MCQYITKNSLTAWIVELHSLSTAGLCAKSAFTPRCNDETAPTARHMHNRTGSHTYIINSRSYVALKTIFYQLDVYVQESKFTARSYTIQSKVPKSNIFNFDQVYRKIKCINIYDIKLVSLNLPRNIS